MMKIKEILRLSFQAQLSQRQIARSLGIGLGTVAQYLKRAQAANLSWPLPAHLQDDDLSLQRLLFPETMGQVRGYPQPDYAQMHMDLKRPGVTKQLLWEEYKQVYPHGYAYSQYCHRYLVWMKQQKRSMRQTHKAGEKLFVDYSGATMGIVNPDTGEIRQAQIFVAVLGASHYTYAEATWSQSQADWIQSHVNTYHFLGGVPWITVPDNLRSAVTKADRYDPKINASYHHMAHHFGTAIIPARPGKPKDKAKVENAVLLVQRWILARLRHQTFFSLRELNEAIRDLLELLNQRAFKQLPGTRRSLFESLDKPVLKPLPSTGYTYTQFNTAQVPPDYHVRVDGHYYSVPHHLVAHRVNIHVTQHGINIYFNGKQVACHVRSHQAGAHTTHPDHMPKAHLKYQGRSLRELLACAQRIGEQTARVATNLIEIKQHPEQTYRALSGLLKLGRQFGDQRLEQACAHAIGNGTPTYRSVLSILKNGLDRLPKEPAHDDHSTEDHENIRGPHYYH